MNRNDLIAKNANEANEANEAKWIKKKAGQ